MAQRPTSLLTWTQGQSSQVRVPAQSLQATGYTFGEAPDPRDINYIFWQLTNWVAYLVGADGATVLQTTLDASTRLVGGGVMTWNSSTSTLTWPSSLSLSVPTLPLSANQLAAGSAVIPANSVLTVQANVPLSVTGSITSGSTTVSNVNMATSIATGASVSGDGIASGTTVASTSSNTVTLSNAATATNETASLTFQTTGALTATVTDMGSLQPTANTVVIAYAQADYIAIGVNAVQMTLRNGEAKTLNGLTGYTSMICANAGVALTARQPLYVSSGSADGRNVGQVYPADASAANGAMRGQFCGFASHNANAGDCAALVSSGLMHGFGSLNTGSVYYVDPANPGAITTTRTSTAGQYIVPCGFAVDNDTLRINPETTRSLTPYTPNLAVSGNLSVQGTTTLVGATTAGAGTAGSWNFDQVGCNNLYSNGVVSGNHVYSNSGFRQQVYIGSCTVPANKNSAYQFVASDGTEACWPTGANGSVVNLQLFCEQDLSAQKFTGPYGGPVAQVYVNMYSNVVNQGTNSTLFYATNGFVPCGTSRSMMYVAFPKGQYTFKDTAALAVGISMITTANFNMPFYCYLTVEMAG